MSLSIYKDFVGVNICVYDPLESDSGSFGNNTNTFGYDPAGYNWYTDSAGIGNNSALTSHGNKYTLVLLNLHRNGVWGYSSWKQIRASQNPLTRLQIRENNYSHVPPCETQDITIHPHLSLADRVNQYATAQSEGTSGAELLSILAGTANPIKFKYAPKNCSIEFQTEPMVTSKYLPLEYNFGYMMKDSRLSEFTLKADLTNECRFFTNDRMNELYTVKLITSEDYEQASVMYLDNSLNNRHNPIDSIELIKYREVVYPRESNTFLDKTRRRNQFTSNEMFWKDDRNERSQGIDITLATAGTTTDPDSSIWPLDPSYGRLFYKNPVKRLIADGALYENILSQSSVPGLPSGFVLNSRVGYTSNTTTGTDGALYSGNNSKDEAHIQAENVIQNQNNTNINFLPINNDSGILQNEYSQFAYFDKLLSVSAKSGYFLLLPTYYRRNTTALLSSMTAPSGIEMTAPTTTIANPAFSSVPTNLRQTELYRGQTKWLAGQQAGYWDYSRGANGSVQRSQFISTPKNPFYDSYEEYSQYIALVGKDYSLVPEFNISNHLNDYKQSWTSQPNLAFLEVKGGGNTKTPVSSSDDTGFYEIYSNTDFLKMFDIVVEDNKETLQPSVLKLTCKAIKKFLPYEGFYPAQRTAEIGQQFHQSYAKNVSVSEGVVMNVSDNESYYWMYCNPVAGALIQTRGTPYPRAHQGLGRAIKPIHTALFSPGILFNTIKSGIATDWPNMTSEDGYTIAGAMGYYSHLPYQVASASAFAYRDFSLLGKVKQTAEADGDNPAAYSVCPYFDNRIPFEALAAPEEYMSSYTVVDTDPDPLGQTTIINQLGEPLDDYYKLMVNNFLAEVPRFFLKQKRFVTFKSKKQGDPKFGNVPDKDKVYGMRVKIYRTMKKPRFKHRAQGGVFSFTSGSVMLPQDRDADYEATLDTSITPQPARVEENFTIYSRTSAFGPPCAGIPPNHPVFRDDQFNHNQGYNFAFTPPYYHGQAYYDIIFSPSSKGSNTINDIFNNSETFPIRFWQGKRNEFGTTITNGVYDDVQSYRLLNVAPKSGFVTDDEYCDTWSTSYEDQDATPATYDFTSTTSFGPAGTVTWPWLLHSDGNNLYGIEKIGYPISSGQPPPNPTPPGQSSSHVFAGSLGSGYGGLGSSAFHRGIQYSHQMNAAKEGSIDIPINSNAMHVDSSVNIFTKTTATTTAGQMEIGDMLFTTDQNADEESRWVIQSKFETPTLNFNHVSTDSLVQMGVKPGALTSGDTLQQPRGMWHQYGYLPKDDEGVFLEITDIPQGWWKVTRKCIYNKPGEAEILSLADLVGFEKTQKRMGEVADRTIIKEAVVAIPFKAIQGRRKYFAIDKDDWRQAVKNHAKSNEVEGTVGNSVVNMVRHMKTYVIPPELDFLNRDGIDPFAMYFFEFKHELTKQDLADIWQNLPPQIGLEHELAEAEVSHELLSNELLGTKRKHKNASGIIKDNKQTLFDSEIQWMVFKVKQRAHKSYKNLIYGNEKETIGDSYNWPYDYFSLVELIKIEAEVELSDIQEEEGQRKPKKIRSKRLRMGDINFDENN